MFLPSAGEVKAGAIFVKHLCLNILGSSRCPPSLTNINTIEAQRKKVNNKVDRNQ